MNISELARRAGLSPSGVRWYEQAGILPPPARLPNGYRDYTDADLDRLTLVLTLRRLGLAPHDAGRLAQQCLGGSSIDADLVDLLATQRGAIARQREDLERLDAGLRDLEATIAASDRAAAPRPSSRAISVLFICSGNSARSQMAEALLTRFGGEDFAVASAGTEPRTVSPLAVRVLAEVGIDWRQARAKPVDDLADQRFDYVITLSDSARDNCRPLPGPHNALHWHLPDPSGAEGSEEDRLAAYRATRTELSVRLRPFIEIARRAAGVDTPKR
jgi:arsenate reductase (thioredoxin)